MKNDFFISLPELAKQLGVSRKTLYEWKHKNYLIPIKIGCRNYYYKEVINTMFNIKIN